jgi:viroplasmin and RNaseH domain-containing protein
MIKIIGFGGAVHKKFRTVEEAQEYINDGKPGASSAQTPSTNLNPKSISKPLSTPRSANDSKAGNTQAASVGSNYKASSRNGNIERYVFTFKLFELDNDGRDSDHSRGFHNDNKVEVSPHHEARGSHYNF